MECSVYEVLILEKLPLGRGWLYFILRLSWFHFWTPYPNPGVWIVRRACAALPLLGYAVVWGAKTKVLVVEMPVFCIMNYLCNCVMDVIV